MQTPAGANGRGCGSHDLKSGNREYSKSLIHRQPTSQPFQGCILGIDPGISGAVATAAGPAPNPVYSGGAYKLTIARINDTLSEQVRAVAAELIAEGRDTNARMVVAVGGQELCRSIGVFAGAPLADYCPRPGDQQTWLSGGPQHPRVSPPQASRRTSMRKIAGRASPATWPTRFGCASGPFGDFGHEGREGGPPIRQSNYSSRFKSTSTASFAHHPRRRHEGARLRA